MATEIWNAAEFITEWDHAGLRYKLLSVPREAIDEGSDEPEAHLLIGLDSGNVRRVEEILDSAYERPVNEADVRVAIAGAPTVAKEILSGYLD